MMEDSFKNIQTYCSKKNEESSEPNGVIIAFAFLLTVVLLFLIGFLVKNLIVDVNDIEFIKNNFNLSLSDFVAEKSERVTYFLLVILSPFLYIGSYFLVSIKAVKEKLSGIFKASFVSNFELVVVLLLTFFLSLFNVFILKFVEFTFITLVLLILIPLLFLFYNRLNKNLKMIINIIIIGLSALAVMLFGLIYMPENMTQSTFTARHFEAYYSPVYKVISGLTIGTDFDAQYGCYPYFYLLFYKLFNIGISIRNFIIINSFLMMFSCSALGYVIWNLIKNKILYLLTFLTCLYFLCLLTMNNGFYLQFIPHRIIFIALILALAVFYLNRKNDCFKKILVILGYFLSSIAIFWNFETGFIVLAAWGGFLSFLEFAKHSYKSKKPYFYLLKTFLFVLISLSCAVLFFEIITLVRSGEILSLQKIFFNQNLYFSLGYYMIKMELFNHPWLLVVLFNLLALTKSLTYLLNQKTENSIIPAMLFMLSIVGFGIFTYYLGRSNYNNLAPTIFPVVIILGCFLSEYYAKYSAFKNSDDKLSKSYMKKFAVLFFIFMLFSIAIVHALGIRHKFYNFKLENSYHLTEKLQELNNLLTVEKYAPIIFSYETDYYYTERGEKDILPFPTSFLMATKAEYTKMFSYLDANKTNPVVFSVEIFDLILAYESDRLNKVLSAYDKKLTTENFLLFVPQKVQ